MLEFQEKVVREVSGCTCDRCGRRMTPDAEDMEWHERISIAWHGGFHSIFGDGRAIRVDLCQHCVRDTLGPWLTVRSGTDDNIEPTSDSLSLGALRGIIAQYAGDAVSVEAMNAAIADSVTASGISDPSSDAGEMPRERGSHWEYRVIEYEEGGEKWRELREVHSISDHGVGCFDTGACVRWTPDDGEQAAESILDCMRAALTRPVLPLSGSRQASDHRWFEAERLADPTQPTSRRTGMEAESVAALINGATWLTGRAVGNKHNPDAALPRAVAIRWKQERRIFSVELAGQTLYPGYVFDERGNPIPEVAEILRLFIDYSPLRIASWFESTSSMLHGKRPRERLATDPAAVVEAARDHVEGSVHG